MGFKIIAENSVVLNTRIAEDINDILLQLIKDTGQSKREIVELSLLDYISKLDKETHFFEGIDIKFYAQVRKQRKIRQMLGIFRTEIKSKATFIKRVEEDLLLMMLCMTPLEEIKRFIVCRKAEAKTYQHNKKLLETLTEYENINSDDYKTLLDELKHKYKQQKVLEIRPNDTLEQVNIK